MILFHVALGLKSGLGHLSRSITLAKYLKKKSNVSFLIPKDAVLARKILNQNNISTFSFEKGKKINELVHIFPKNIKAIIIDISDAMYVKKPYLLTEYFHKIREKQIKLIVIDGLFKDRIISKDYPIFDILIQPYIEVNLNEKASAIKHLRGPDYVILDNAFKKNIQIKQKYIPKLAKSIVISFGGSDPTLLTNEFCKFLTLNKEIFKEQSFTIILGPYMEKKNQYIIKSQIKEWDNVSIKNNIFNLKPFFDKSDLAILASGSTTRYEAASCGTPTLFFGINKDHEIQCKIYEKSACAKYLGQQSEIIKSSLLEELVSIINNKTKRHSMSKLGLNLIDGKGTFRLACEIFKIGL